MLRRVTVGRVMVVAVFVAVIVVAARPPTDTDTWWHIRSGQATLTDGFIRADSFSHSVQGKPWVNHSWGAQVILYGAYAALRDAGLVLYTVILATAGMGFVWAAARGSVYVRGFVVVLGALAAALFWSARPQMISFALSGVVVWLLYDYADGKRGRMWLFVPLMLLWANAHAGFTIGFILLGGTVAGLAVEQWTADAPPVDWRGIFRLVVIGLVGLAATMVNPYGPRLLLVPFQTVGLETLSTFIQEWQPPDYRNSQVFPFVVLAVLTVGALGITWRRVRPHVIVLVAGTLYMALTAGRNVAVFAVVAVPPLTWHIDMLLSGGTTQARRMVPARMGAINAVLIGVLMLGGAVMFGAAASPAAVAAAQAQLLPVDATTFIREETDGGRLFNSYNWGGYLMWALPDSPVFIDGRTDLYGDKFIREYLEIYTATNSWDAALDEYEVELVIVEPESGIAAALSDQAGWARVYEDEMAVIFRPNMP